MPCPPHDVLEKFLNGLLPDGEHERIESHVSTCITCQKFRSDSDASSSIVSPPSKPPSGSSVSPLQTGSGSGAFDETIFVDSDRPPADTATQPDAARPSSVGDLQQAIPGYKILRELHRGGQGVVYKAIQEAAKRHVALKVMLEGPFASAAAKRRFEREIELAANLRHPNITPVFDSGIAAGRYYYAMEYVQGLPLDQYVEGHRFSVEQTLHLFQKICSAVNFAHQHGVIHRDLKPGNILVDDDGEPHVLDFGLAKQTGSTEPEAPSAVLSVAGQMMGTLPYMSPEQARGASDAVDIRSDVYALGIILYQILTGRFPYDVTGQMVVVLHNITDAEPKRPSLVNPQVDDEVETIILKTLAKEPERRYQSAGELNNDIGRYLIGEAIEAKRDSGIYMLKKALRRHRIPVAIASCFFVLILVFGVAMFGLYRAANAARADAEVARQTAENALLSEKQARADEEVQRKRAQEEETKAKKLAELEAKARTRAEEQEARAVKSAEEAKKAAEEAKQQRQMAETSAQKEREARTLAEQQQKEADRAKAEAVAAAEKLALEKQNLVRSLVRGDILQAQLYADKGQAGRSWLHCARAVALADQSKVDASLARAWLVQFAYDQAPIQLIGHEAAAASYQFSPDGKRIATASERTLRLFDVGTGEAVGNPMPHEAGIRVIAFLPDADRLLTLSTGDVIRLWQLPDCRQNGEDRKISSGGGLAAFSPNGGQLLTTNTGREASLWDTSTGQRIGQIMQHQAGINVARFSPDGSLALTASRDGIAQIWTAAAAQLRGTPIKHDSPISDAAFTPDSRRMATASADGIRFFDVDTGQPVGKPLLPTSKMQFARLTFNASGDLLATAATEENGQNLAQVWNAESLRPVGTPMLHEAWINTLSFDETARLLITTTADDQAYVWDINTSQITAGPIDFAPGSIYGTPPALAHSGARMATANSAGTLQIWDTAGFLSRQIPMKQEGRVRLVSVSPEGSCIAAASDDQTLTLRSLATQQAIGNALPNRAVLPQNALLFSPDGKLVITTPAEDTVQLVEAATGRPLPNLLKHEGLIHTAVFSPDGKLIVTCSADRTARLWQVQTGTSIGAPMQHSGPVRDADFSHDGKWIITADADKAARLFNAADAAPVGNPIPHESAVKAVRFSPDSQRVLTLCLDMAVRIWDPQNGKQLGAPITHESPINTAVFSPDGNWVATASDDQTARLWHADTGKPAGPPLVHENLVTSAVFSPDSKFLLTACDDGSARLWSVLHAELAGKPFRHSLPVRSVAFSPDGTLIATGSFDKMVRLWHVYTKENAEILNLKARITTVSRFDEEGKMTALSPQEWRADKSRLADLLRAHANASP